MLSMEKGLSFTHKDTETHTHMLTHFTASTFLSPCTISVAPVFLRLVWNVIDFPARFYFGYVGNIW